MYKGFSELTEVQDYLHLDHNGSLKLMKSNNLFLALHNTHSRNTVKLFADTVMNFPSFCKNVVFSKISASAASIGIPDAQKTILSKGGSLFFFSEVTDIIETLQPHKVYLLVPRKFGKEVIPFERIYQESQNKKILVILGGSSPGLTRKELDMGECIFLDEISSNLNPVSLASIFLYGLSQINNDRT